MSNTTVGVHVVAVVLALLQCALAAVLAYRLYLLSHTSKGVDPHRRATTVNILKVHRACIFIMTALQCLRVIDPFSALGIWPYGFVRFLQLAVTISIYFQYSSTTYIVMDTLYACVLKRTPTWLAIIISILPVSEFVVGFGMLAAEYLVGQQWVGAVVSFYVVLMLTVNLTTYNVSGVLLIRLLRNHQSTGAGEDISGSKSASPFDVVISKTLKSMTMLTLPSLATWLIFLVLGVSNCNTRPMPVFDPNALQWNVIATMFIQLILGLLFTRVAWISKTALEAAIVGKISSTPSSGGAVSSEGTPQKRSDRAASRAELKERAKRMSQSPNHSEGTSSAQGSHADQPVVVAVDAKSENSQGSLVPGDIV